MVDRTYGLFVGNEFDTFNSLSFAVACNCSYADRLSRAAATKDNYCSFKCADKGCEYRVSAASSGLGAWTISTCNLTHSCPLPTVKQRVKSTPFTPLMFVNLIVNLLKADPNLKGRTIRAAIDMYLGSFGLQNSPLSVDFIYRVKKLSLQHIYGPRSKWFSKFRGWAVAT